MMFRIALLGSVPLALAGLVVLGTGSRAAEPDMPACALSAVAKAAGADAAIDTVSVQPIPGGPERYQCRITGRAVTRGDGAGVGSASFELNLPATWNGKFLFRGGSGFDGFVPPPDAQRLLAGYATVGTDSGHQAKPEYPSPGTDASWVRLPSGEPDRVKLADFHYRARHSVNGVARAITRAFYDRPVRYSYFMGCSGGGREALVQAERYPQDFDGIVAGAPSGGPLSGLLTARSLKAFVKAPIPYSAYEAIDAAVDAQCDAADGVRDHLIQNPAQCDFDPRVLVERGVLTRPQGEALRLHLSALLDENGRLVGPGYPVTGLGDLSGRSPIDGVGADDTGRLTGLGTFMTRDAPTHRGSQPWGSLYKGPVNWLLAHGRVADFTYNDPAKDILGDDVIDARGRATASAVERTNAALGDMSASPARFGPMLSSGRKLLIYHGYSDTITNPYFTVQFYRALAQRAGGYQPLSRSVRLFAVPEMQHCRGGRGPDSFDPLAAMEQWVERGTAPASIVATKYAQPTHAVLRTMPVCPYPAEARFSGHGDVNAAANWSCRPRDERQLKIGGTGVRAGMAVARS